VVIPNCWCYFTIEVLAPPCAKGVFLHSSALRPREGSERTSLPTVFTARVTNRNFPTLGSINEHCGRRSPFDANQQVVIASYLFLDTSSSYSFGIGVPASPTPRCVSPSHRRKVMEIVSLITDWPSKPTTSAFNPNSFPGKTSSRLARVSGD
jgi:hypothetical protein